MTEIIFVGGAHKSGTTLVASCIASAPGTSAFVHTGVPMDEGQWLQDVLPPDAYLGELLFGLSDEAFLNETDCDRFPGAAARLLACWRPHWDSSQHTWIEKSPMNAVRTRFLQELFPGAVFVTTMRDPRASFMAARKTMPLVSPEVYFRSWVRVYDAYLHDAPQLRRALLIPFEDLMRYPRSQLKRIESVSGLRIRDDVTAEFRVEHHSRYLEAWRNEVDVETQARCIGLLPRWCAEYGYNKT
jgi:hypothetical protein